MVKVQGQNRHIENFHIAIGFESSSPNLTIRQASNFDMKYDFQQRSRWRPGEGLYFLSAF